MENSENSETNNEQKGGPSFIKLLIYVGVVVAWFFVSFRSCIGCPDNGLVPTNKVHGSLYLEKTALLQLDPLKIMSTKPLGKTGAIVLLSVLIKAKCS